MDKFLELLGRAQKSNANNWYSFVQEAKDTYKPETIMLSTNTDRDEIKKRLEQGWVIKHTTGSDVFLSSEKLVNELITTIHRAADRPVEWMGRWDGCMY